MINFLKFVVKSTVVVTLISVLCLNLERSKGYSAESNIPTASFISAALNQQQYNTSSIEVNYTDTQVGLNGPPAVYCYRRTPRFWYVEEYKGDFINKSSFDRDTKETRSYSLRKENEESRREIGTIWHDLTGPLSRTNIYDPVNLHLNEELLYELIARGQVIGQENIDGYQCYRIDVSLDSNRPVRQYRVWVDPSIGYCPRRIEGQNDQNYLSTYTFSNYELYGSNVWMPKSIHTCIKTNSDQFLKQFGSYSLDFDYVATSIKIGNAFTDQDLTVSFPKGIKVLQDGLEVK